MSLVYTPTPIRSLQWHKIVSASIQWLKDYHVHIFCLGIGYSTNGPGRLPVNIRYYYYYRFISDPTTKSIQGELMKALLRTCHVLAAQSQCTSNACVRTSCYSCIAWCTSPWRHTLRHGLQRIYRDARLTSICIATVAKVPFVTMRNWDFMSNLLSSYKK
jgi:hypothetical protein